MFPSFPFAYLLVVLMLAVTMALAAAAASEADQPAEHQLGQDMFDGQFTFPMSPTD